MRRRSSTPSRTPRSAGSAGTSSAPGCRARVRPQPEQTSYNWHEEPGVRHKGRHFFQMKAEGALAFETSTVNLPPKGNGNSVVGRLNEWSATAVKLDRCPTDESTVYELLRRGAPRMPPTPTRRARALVLGR